MDIIGYGILLAVGFYIAPIVITAIIVVVGGFFAVLGNIFGGER